MVSSHVENLVHDVRYSSVTTSRVTGNDKLRELGHLDLAMKLHYIKAVYFFRGDAVQGMDIYALKKPMFEWLDLYQPTAGRIRRSESGRPFIKCNDSGVRIVEAKCRRSIDEWLGSRDRCKLDDQLVRSQVLGPELGFSPLVYLQFTWFSCGGLSVGLSWAHILGDCFSASTFITTWAQMIAQSQLPREQIPRQQITDTKTSQKTTSPLRAVDPVGDTWQVPNGQKMETHCFQVTEKVLQKAGKVKTFPFLAALFWKSVSKIRKLETEVVTICAKGFERRGNRIPDNSQVIATVEADFNVQEADLSNLAKWVDEKVVDARSVIEDNIEKDGGKSDFVVYGANLTFVNLEDADIYGLEIRGKKPVFANYVVDGVGEEGAVLVLPRAEENGGHGRMVTVILPENQIVELKNVLKKDWGIF